MPKVNEWICSLFDLVAREYLNAIRGYDSEWALRNDGDMNAQYLEYLKWKG